MRLIVFAVLAISTLASAAQAGDWRLAVVGRSSGLAVDLSTLVVDGTKTTAWTAVVLSSTVADFDYALVRYEYDCRRRTSAKLVSIYYDASGQMTNRNDTPMAAVAIAPDSNEVFLMDAACFGKFQVDDPEGWDNARTLLHDYRGTSPE